MRRLGRYLVVCVLCIAEPCLHALGVPHPEGLSSMALNYLATSSES